MFENLMVHFKRVVEVNKGIFFVHGTVDKVKILRKY